MRDRNRYASGARVTGGVPRQQGQLLGDVDTELAIDLLFGAVVFRLVNGSSPLTAQEASAIAN